MPRSTHLRRVALAAVTIAGAFHVRTADAATTPPPCQAWAEGYAAGFCAAHGHAGWSSVFYTCNEDGTANILRVVCQG